MSKANRTIWRTVVFTGAMLGGGCGPKPAATTTTPANTTTPTTAPAAETTKPTAEPAALEKTDNQSTPQSQTQKPADSTATQDPCSGGEVTPAPRPRTTPDRPHGRGFVLS